ncbi:MAG: PmeII family type II restriction endonuclease [Patescibacteria group bacterium]
MAKLSMPDIITEYVSSNIGEFHQNRLLALEKVSLDKILKRKNVYLFKAKNILTSEVFIKQVLDAFLSSQEETMFGKFLEGLAIFICSKVYGGGKSAAEGIDLEFKKGGKKYIVAIKSGPNWGNSSQYGKMKLDFKKAKRILNTNSSRINIVAVNGCCYGRDNAPDKGEYLKYCGQKFWEFISGNPNLYIEIVEPLGFKAREKNEEFQKGYASLVNKFTLDFSKRFCKDGKIDWESIVELNSGQ